jgi:hypothetical protein
MEYLGGFILALIIIYAGHKLQQRFDRLENRISDLEARLPDSEASIHDL